MLSDFLHARFCLDFDDSEGTRTIRRGRESLSLSIRLTFRYRLALPRCGVARDHWLYHSSRTVVRKRVASGLVNVAPLALALPLLHRVPTSAPQTATALNAPSSMKQSNPPVADGSLIPRYRETFLSSSSFDRASVSLRAWFLSFGSCEFLLPSEFFICESFLRDGCLASFGIISFWFLSTTVVHWVDKMFLLLEEHLISTQLGKIIDTRFEPSKMVCR